MPKLSHFFDDWLFFYLAVISCNPTFVKDL